MRRRRTFRWPIPPNGTSASPVASPRTCPPPAVTHVVNEARTGSSARHSSQPISHRPHWIRPGSTPPHGRGSAGSLAWRTHTGLTMRSRSNAISASHPPPSSKRRPLGAAIANRQSRAARRGLNAQPASRASARKRASDNNLSYSRRGGRATSPRPACTRQSRSGSARNTVLHARRSWSAYRARSSKRCSTPRPNRPRKRGSKRWRIQERSCRSSALAGS